jgi:hypothetical protein
MLASAIVLAATATLVVPYFEVSIEPENRNFDTRFTIANESAEPAKARINVWTDRGHPVLYYTTLLEPKSSKTVSMRDMILTGAADICASPGHRVPIVLQEAMRCQLTTGCRVDFFKEEDCSKRVGERHAHAIGYVTVDLVDDCMDLTSPDVPDYELKRRVESVLSGTFEQIAFDKVIASGPLVDRAGGPIPRFAKPRFPRDPLAARPPRHCPPFSSAGPQF